MVVGAFPVAKLGTLLLRQISKPVANFVKERAKNNQFFRTYVCMPPAQIYNWCEVKMKMWVMNLGKTAEVPSLNEAMAIELGANLLGEAIIFTIAAGLLLMEYSRQVRKESAKEEAKVQDMAMLTTTIQDLYFQAEMHDTQIKELMRHVHDLETILKKPKGPFSGLTKDLNPPDNNDGAQDVCYCIAHPGLILRSVHYLTDNILCAQQA